MRIRRARARRHIVGLSPQSETHARPKAARSQASSTECTKPPPRRSRDADLVILCVPVGAYGEIAAAIAPHLQAGAILTDVGSVKGAVVRDVGPHVPDGVHFIPGHPIAGTEQSGPEAGFAELFDNRWCILTPLPGTDADAGGEARRHSGGRSARMSSVMDAEHHDLVLAITSHLPHLIAYNIVGDGGRSRGGHASRR